MLLSFWRPFVTNEIFLVIKYFIRKTCLFVDSLLTYLELFIVCSSGSIGLLFWHLPRGHELYSANRTACLENAKSQLYVGQNPPARNNCFCSLWFFLPLKLCLCFCFFFGIKIYYDCEKPSCPRWKCTTVKGMNIADKQIQELSTQLLFVDDQFAGTIAVMAGICITKAMNRPPVALVNSNMPLPLYHLILQ